MTAQRKVVIVLLTVLMLLTGCSAQSIEDNETADPAVITRTLYGDSIVDYLYNQKKGNVIISNVSINMALAMLLEGSNGDTQKQLEEYLGFSKEDARMISRQLLDSLKGTTTLSEYDEDKTCVEIANSLWLSKEAVIKGEYQKLLEDYFDATAQSLDFLNPKSADIINGWLNDKTKGLIPEIINADDMRDLYMVLLNALYMKGIWTEKYAGTSEGTFNGFTVDVLKSTENIYYENDYATAFGKDIKGNYEMIAILPKKEGEFTLESLDIEGLLKTKNYEFDVKTVIPVLELEYSTELVDVLKGLGVKDAFDPYLSDLSDIRDINGDSRLYVSNVIHKTHVRIDENGFEGAAATAIEVRLTFLPKERKEVIIDRPFVFMIIDKTTGTAIFTGKVVTLEQ